MRMAPSFAVAPSGVGAVIQKRFPFGVANGMRVRWADEVRFTGVGEFDLRPVLFAIGASN
jgi:hypothetical protein